MVFLLQTAAAVAQAMQKDEEEEAAAVQKRRDDFFRKKTPKPTKQEWVYNTHHECSHKIKDLKIPKSLFAWKLFLFQRVNSLPFFGDQVSR